MKFFKFPFLNIYLDLFYISRLTIFLQNPDMYLDQLQLDFILLYELNSERWCYTLFFCHYSYFWATIKNILRALLRQYYLNFKCVFKKISFYRKTTMTSASGIQFNCELSVLLNSSLKIFKKFNGLIFISKMVPTYYVYNLICGIHHYMVKLGNETNKELLCLINFSRNLFPMIMTSNNPLEIYITCVFGVKCRFSLAFVNFLLIIW